MKKILYITPRPLSRHCNNLPECDGGYDGYKGKCKQLTPPALEKD